MEINDTLKQRQSTHGTFKANAKVSQGICECLRLGDSYAALTDAQVEALEMIAHKMARIVNGTADFADHWHDIAGYAKLAEQLCTNYDGAIDE